MTPAEIAAGFPPIPDDVADLVAALMTDTPATSAPTTTQAHTA